MEEANYLITHLGRGKFSVMMDSDVVKEAGPNLCGMIQYTYFEDGTMPHIGWQISRGKLMQDYLPKMQADVLSGKLKPSQTNY
jgi:hypothetical protein